MKNILNVLIAYKYYTAICGITLFLLLIRIPLGTFNEGSEIDMVGHFLLPAAGAPLLYAWLKMKGIYSGLRSSGIILTIALLGIGVEVLWEIIEFIVDGVFNLGWQVSNADTMVDLTLALVGATLGGYSFVKIRR